MATVYLAQDLKHERPVAIKVLLPELAAAFVRADRFLREIKLTAGLNHPHVLPLLDSGEADGFLYYVMPYVAGESLRDRLRREKQMPLDAALAIACEVADGLEYAHRHDVIHRDIKPENILLEGHHAVIADFGIARAISDVGGERLTATGVAVGTPEYMSPEQVTGRDRLDGRSDIYALGCVLYEMLAGEPPFTGPSAQAVVAKRLGTPAPAVSILRDTVPKSVEAALSKALARSPADRFATAAQFAQALQAAPEPPRRGRAWRTRRVAVIAGGFALAAALALKVGLLGARHPATIPVAILPLVNLSGDSAQEYLADGVTDALITELGKVSALTVTSRTSAMLYKGSLKPLRQIARELGVDHVVEGSFLWEGGQVHITARLIAARDERRLWTETYDRPAGTVLALYEEAARTIAGAIGATLKPEERSRLAASAPVDTAAYKEYLIGNYQAGLWTAEGFTRAIEHYRRATALAPDFALPYAGLVEAYTWSGGLGTMSPMEAGPLAIQAAERAVALDPQSAQAHAALAEARLQFQWRFADVEREFRWALELNPSLATAHYLYGWFLTGMGRHDEAVAETKRARQLDPLQMSYRIQMGWVCFYASRYQESIGSLDSALALDSTLAWAHNHLSWNYSAMGRHQEAVAAIDRALRLALRGDPGNQIILSTASFVYARAGRPAEAHRYLDSLLAMSRTEVVVDPYVIAAAYAWLGDTDRALELYGRAVDRRSFGVWALKVEFLPQRFKADPRFKALLRRMGNE